MNTDPSSAAAKQESSPEAPKDRGSEAPNNSAQIPATSKKQAFDDVMTPLTATELADPGTQKVILYMLNEAKTEIVQLEGFVERFHDADKRAAVLQEQVDFERKTSRSTDIAFGVGSSLGGALIGAGFFFWSITPPQNRLGWFFIVVGLGLLVGGAFVKFAKR